MLNRGPKDAKGRRKPASRVCIRRSDMRHGFAPFMTRRMRSVPKSRSNAPTRSRRSADRSTPLQHDADISRHAAGKIDNLRAQPVVERTQAAVPELVDFLRDAGQSLLPPGLLLVDRSSAIGAERVGKSIDLDLGQSILGSTIDDGR